MMNNQQAMIELIKAISGQANVLTIPRPYIEFMGSLDGGLFLSQLIYWSDRGGGDGWFYKTYAEWENELTLSKYEVTKQAKILKDKGILKTKIKKANGAPTVHYHFSFDQFQQSFVEFLNYGKSSNLTMESEVTLRTITETTTETTTDINGSAKNPQTPTSKKPFGSGLNPSESQRKERLNTLAAKIAIITQTDIDTAGPKTREALKGLTIAISKKPNPEIKLPAYEKWWYVNDWRGKQGQPPTVWHIGDTWGQFEADKVAPANGAASPGPALSDEARENYQRLIAAEKAK